MKEENKLGTYIDDEVSVKVKGVVTHGGVVSGECCGSGVVARQ